MQYYNALAGSWEPAVEGFDLSLTMEIDSEGKKDIKIHLGEREKTKDGEIVDKDININLSEALFKTIADTLNSINQANTLQMFKHNDKPSRALV